MRVLPTDATGWLVVLAAGANLAAHAAMLTLVAVHKTAVLPRIWDSLLLGQVPTVLLLVAAGLSSRRGTPVRGVAIAAGLLATFGEYCFLDPWLGGPLGAAAGDGRAVATLAAVLADGYRLPYAIAVTALVPAAVGWWQRRRDSSAVDDDAGDDRA